MEKHLKDRPRKKVFGRRKINSLRGQAIDKVKSKLLPNKKIIKVILIGSAIKNFFGEYEPPGFRGSLYSDFDFIVFVEDDYEIPKWLHKEPDGRPFSENRLNLAYRNKKFIDKKYDAEVFFIRERSILSKIYRKEAEDAGIPISRESKHKYFLVYSKETHNGARMKIPKSKTKHGFGGARKGGRFHAGTDILMSYGSSVKAFEEGVVKKVFLFTYPGLDKYNEYNKTYSLAVKHNDGNYGLYAEIQKPKLKIGQKVKKGQIIAKVGRVFVGSNKTMLHFEHHSKLPTRTTKWYRGKRPKGLLSSTKYLVNAARKKE